ncbi:MAG: hypothetical protein K1X91_14070 [Bacteriodetes bacterium]|nr:hypothetical protein [Bacteroidota bacterium]
MKASTNSRAYIIVHDAWYANFAAGDNSTILFGLIGSEKNLEMQLEMKMVWITTGELSVSPHLYCRLDNVRGIKEFSDVFDELANIEKLDFTELDFISILQMCGFVDITPYELIGALQK